MVKVVSVVAIVVAVLAGALLMFAATKPDTFRVERSLSMKAPPDKVFPFINELRSWRLWSPYEKKDPGMQRTYSGSSMGKGAVYEWDGNKDVGRGRMEITDASAPSKVIIKLDFIAPFEGHNIAAFTLEPKGDVTNVSWAMHGPSPLLAKVMHIFMNIDKMIGDDFEAGLVNLKAAVEK